MAVTVWQMQDTDFQRVYCLVPRQSLYILLHLKKKKNKTFVTLNFQLNP